MTTPRGCFLTGRSAKSANRQDANSDPQQVLNVCDKSGEIEQRPSWIHFHPEVDIAGCVTIAPGTRPKDPDVPSTIELSQSHDLSPLLPANRDQGVHGHILRQIRTGFQR